MEKFLQVGQSPDATSKIILNELAPGLPDGLPEYPGSKLVGSTVTTSAEGKVLGVLSETGDPVDQVYIYFENAFATEPWRVQFSTFAGKVAGVQFTNPIDTTVTGGVVVQPASDGGGSLIFLSVQLVAGSNTAEPFKLEPSKQLPMGWPEQVLIYPGATVTDTGWGQDGKSIQWQITLLVQGTLSDFVEFYRAELTKAGFTVNDVASQAGVSTLSFKGAESDETWEGAVSAQAFAQDPTYVQATIQVVVSATASQQSGTPSP